MKSTRKAVVNIAIGFQFGVTFTLMVLIGYWLDNRYDSSPAFVVGGAVFGMVIGFYHLIKELNRVNKEAPETEDRKKIKWMSFF